MALDKQKILSELGSVMHQLQGADCGCMGKLFSNPGQTGQVMGNLGNTLPNSGGCRRGCCHGHGTGPSYGPGYNTSLSAGDSHTPMNPHCVGHCNPPKLYADTYGYLNQNLMQPVVREVYNDLKSITPENTIMNNPLANQMGLPVQTQNAGPIIHETIKNMPQNQMPERAINNNNITQNMNNSYSNQQMGQMGGMGPQILNMMLGDSSSNSKNMTGQTGQTAAAQAVGMPNEGQGSVGSQLPSVRNKPIQRMHAGDTEAKMNVEMSQIAQNNFDASREMGNINTKPNTMHQMAANNKPYGQHFQGVTKFKEMFPGAMQGLGGDLNFDPMALAIQMNPDNKQRAAMDAMNNMFAGNGTSKVSNTGQPSSSQVQQNILRGNQQLELEHPTINPTSQITPSHEHYTTGAIPNQHNQPQYHQQLQPQYQQLQYQTQYQQPSHRHKIIEQTTSAPVMPSTLPTLYEGSMDSNSEIQHLSPHSASPVQQIIKEPIFPVNTTRNQDHSMKQFEYNTLGQPVEMFPARMYRVPEPNLPQTLAPQAMPNRLRNGVGKYSNVKTTVSKTSLMANLPLGKTPSRSQLQQVYNQYKGSQSYTEQNIRAPGHGGTQSEGQLKIAQQKVNQPRQVPIERIGGDTTAYNQMAHNRNEIEKNVEQVIGHIGDVPNAKPHSDVAPQMEVPSNQSKCRNGLQDIVYTSPPSSAAWSFHGNSRAPLYSGYRFRNKS